MATIAQARPAGPTAASERALGPDLARGFMLLFIALANSHYFLRGDVVRGGFPMDGSWLDSAVTWLIATFVDGRAFPMFGLLFGYGVAQLVRRNEALGPRGVRRLLWRRSLVLIVVGFLHAMLLFVGDILAAYGVLLLLGAWTVRWRARWLVLPAAAFFALLMLPSADSLSISTDPPDASMLPPDLAGMVSERIVVQPSSCSAAPSASPARSSSGCWPGGRASWSGRPSTGGCSPSRRSWASRWPCSAPSRWRSCWPASPTCPARRRWSSSARCTTGPACWAGSATRR